MGEAPSLLMPIPVSTQGQSTAFEKVRIRSHSAGKCNDSRDEASTCGHAPGKEYYG